MSFHRRKSETPPAKVANLLILPAVLDANMSTGPNLLKLAKVAKRQPWPRDFSKFSNRLAEVAKPAVYRPGRQKQPLFSSLATLAEGQAQNSNPNPGGQHALPQVQPQS